MTINLTLDLHYKQGTALQSIATEILYGGAAGGGKSHLMRVCAILWCLEIPGLQVYLFRRTFPDLMANHMNGAGSFPFMLVDLIAVKKVEIVKDEIRFWNGSKIHLCHCQHEKDVMKYQGAEIHVLCCEENERVRMGDGTLKPVKDLSIGDMVMTMRGPRAITWLGERHRKPCVAAELRNSNGDIIGVQIHSETHKILNPNGAWFSFLDMCDESHLSGISSPTLYPAVCKSAQQSYMQDQSVRRPLDNLGSGQQHSELPQQLFSGHQSLPESAVCKVLLNQGNDSVSFACEHRELRQLSSNSEFPVVLYKHRHDLAGRIAEGASPRDEMPCAQTLYMRQGYRENCLSSHHQYDEPQDHQPDRNHDDAPLQGDAVAHIPKRLTLDASDIIHKYNPYTLKYDHPYGGGERQATEDFEIGSCEFSPCGEKWVIDITVEDENHYITEHGLVNRNCIDELTHFLESQYRFLRGRVRLGGLKVPEKYKGCFPRILTGSNPGSVGHAWVKRTFVDFAAAFDIIETQPEEGGLKRQYIPALLEDNPTLTENDPDYEMRLLGLGSPDLVKAMRYGLWDITAGAAFEKLSREKHQLRPFKVPDHWMKFMVIDWGSSKPFSVGWYCVPAEDTELAAKGEWPARFIPKNALIRYREYYGWNGKPNEGARMESPEVAKRILEIEEEHGEIMDYRVGDSAMWAKHDGPSTEERMRLAGEEFGVSFTMEKSRKDRQANYLEIRTRLEGEDGLPMLYATANCLHFWRTVPDLQLDEKRPEEGWDTTQEDHCFAVGTLVRTSTGLIAIESLKTGDMVLTTKGYLPCVKLGMTAITETIIVEFEDGYMCEVTPNHPFLLMSGEYKKIGTLMKGDTVCRFKSSTPLLKGSMDKTIGYAGSISNVEESGCTGLYGNITMALSHMGIIYTTKTVIGRITRLITLSLLAHQSMRDYTPTRGTHQTQREPEEILIRQELPLAHGTVVQKGGWLTPNGGKVSNQRQNILNRAIRVIKNLWPNFLKVDSAQMSAQQGIGELRIRDMYAGNVKPVYNISVPGPENYVLANGLIVHNCVDELAYACASEPYGITLSQRVKDEYKEAQRKVKEKRYY